MIGIPTSWLRILAAILSAVFIVGAVAPVAPAVVVNENFDDDPFWAKLNNPAGSDNYGYSPTTNFAGGAVGEAGGLFGRHDAFDSFYADLDLGGTISVRDPVQSSGRISIDSTLNPQFNMNISFFDARDPSKGGDALRIHIIEGGKFLVWLRQVVGKTHQSPITSGLANGDYQWTMTWNPAGNGGLGSGTVTFNGLTPGTPASLSATLNMPVRNEPGRPPRWIDENTVFNAFGLQVYDAEATTSGQYKVHIDNVSYTAVMAPGTSAAWKRRNSGLWTDSRNWTPGEVPFGADQSALFGGGLIQNSTVFVQSPVTVKSIEFNNSAFRYAIAGDVAVTLDDVANTMAFITVTAGQHEIQAPLSLADNALITAATGTRLDVNNHVSLNGHQLFVSGGGTVSLNAEVAGSIAVSAATLMAEGGSVAGNLVLSDATVLSYGGSSAPLRVNGAAALAGALDLDFAGSPTIREGAIFTVLTAEAIVDNGLHLSARDAQVFKLIIGSQSVAVRALTAIPEPAALGLAAWALLVGVTTARRNRRTAGRSIVGVVVAASIGLAASPSSAELVGQHFNTDPGWTGFNNVLPQGSPSRERDDFNNYRYNGTTYNALGSPGEVGGYFGMNTFNSYYGDTTLGGNLGGGSPPLTQALHASGKLMVNADHSPTWNMNIGFFDVNNPGASGDAVRFSIIELSPGYRLMLQIRQQGNGYNGPLLDGVNHLLDGFYEFSMDYNPTGGVSGAGRLSLNMWGTMTVSTFVDVDAAGKNHAMTLNAFGYTNYDSGTSRPDTNKHYTFMDDLVYTTQETADPVVRWAGPGSGSWNNASRWQRTSTTDGGGFVPDGSDRTALFGSGATQDVVAFVDQDVRVKRIEFNNSHQHVIAGTGRVMLESNSGPATIEVFAGSHQFQAATKLNSDANVTVGGANRLEFQNSLNLNGRTLSIAAGSRVYVNNRLDIPETGVVQNLGRLGGVGRINGDLYNFPGGTIVPGAEPSAAGQLLVDGILVQTAGGKLAIDLGGTTAGAFDLLTVGGSAFLAGEMELTRINSFVPQPGARFEVLTAAGGINATGLQLTGQNWGFDAGLENGGTSLVLTYVDADFVDDDILTGADLASWRGGFGTATGATHAQGDADGDDDVDGRDFLIWQRQFGGMAAAAPAASGIPEPSALALVMLAAGGVAVRHRKSQRPSLPSGVKLLQHVRHDPA